MKRRKGCSADIIINHNGEEKVVNTVEKGETIGEMGVLTRQKRSAKVVTASEYNELLVIQRKKLTLEPLLFQENAVG